jgi:hypothetical protein
MEGDIKLLQRRVNGVLYLLLCTTEDALEEMTKIQAH